MAARLELKRNFFMAIKPTKLDWYQVGTSHIKEYEKWR
jgi:hypothetical protein